MGRALSLILFGIVTVILATVGLTACAPQTGVQLGEITLGSMDSQETAVATYIVIAGKITEPTSGAWLNNYSVIPYLDGQEISNPQNRAISRTGKYMGSGEGVHDGLFILYIPNQYELTATHDFINANGRPINMQYADGGFVGASDLYIWLGEVNPGDIFRLAVPAKQIEYAIAVMPTDNEQLDSDIHQNNTILQEDGRITTIETEKSSNKTMSTTSTQRIRWTRPYIAPQNSTIRETWSLYIENQVPSMNWTTYYTQLLLHNPELVQTGNFVAGQLYYLPQLSDG